VHSGQYSAYLCGYIGCDDRIWQTFTAPTSFTKITITYWWYSDTNKSTNKCYDYFTSSLRTSSNSIIQALQNDCNTKVTNQWVSKTYDLTSVLSKYKGQQVTLFFQGTNAPNQYQPTDFFIDDVVMSVQKRPDYGLSKNTTDDEIGTSTVTPSLRSGQALSAAKGLSRWAARCFAAFSMTGLSSIRMSGLFC